MIDFSDKAISFRSRSARRLRELCKTGYLNLSELERLEADALQKERLLLFYRYLSRRLAGDYPVVSDLARALFLDKGSVSKYLKGQLNPTDTFIGRVSSLDDRYAPAFLAYRAITDCFFMEPDDLDVVERVAERVHQKHLADMRGVLDKMRDMIEGVEEDYTGAPTENGEARHD